MPPAKNETPEQRERRLAKARDRQARYDARRRKDSMRERVSGGGGADGKLLGLGFIKQAGAINLGMPGANFEFHSASGGHLSGGMTYEQFLDRNDADAALPADLGPAI